MNVIVKVSILAPFLSNMSRKKFKTVFIKNVREFLP